MARLDIVWDGQTPGLKSRRLSLAQFGPALTTLLASIRRTARDIEMGQVGRQESSRGRLTAQAENLDVQLLTIRTNSPVELVAEVVYMEPPSQQQLFSLPELTVRTFLQGLRQEAKDVRANVQARRFLDDLPDGLSRQTYKLQDETGAVLEEVSIGQVRRIRTGRSPHFVRVSGRLVGVGFEEGRQEVKVRAQTGEIVSFEASDELVEEALRVRKKSHVFAFGVVVHYKPRLLRLELQERSRRTIEERNRAVLDRWDGLLARLAR